MNEAARKCLLTYGYSSDIYSRFDLITKYRIQDSDLLTFNEVGINLLNFINSVKA
jgi:hypothetical protein